MTVVQDIFDSFSLDRMIMEFAWYKTANESNENGKADFIYNKYHDTFLSPDFVIKKKSNSSFVQVDIRKLHQDYYSEFLPINNEVQIPSKAPPKSLDYLDIRLQNTPSDIHTQLLDIKKLDHKCFVSLHENKMFFDCNFEQLTLIMQILEDSLQFHPLVLKEGHFNYSSQVILPWFNTHSYAFSFDFSLGLKKMFAGLEIENVLLDLLRNITKDDIALLDEVYPLSGFDGINVAIKNTSDVGSWIIQYEVSNVFTKSLMLLDRSAIQKTSLWFFNELLKCLKTHNIKIAHTLTNLMDELAAYIT